MKCEKNEDQDLSALAREYFQTGEITCKLLKGDGSNRKIYLITLQNKKSPVVVGVTNNNLKENRDYFIISEKMQQIGIPVPEIYSIHPAQTSYLLQYLGPCNLADRIEHWKSNNQFSKIGSAYEKVLPFLLKIQNQLPKVLGEFLSHRLMAKKDFLDDLAYFQRDFLERFGYIHLYSHDVKQELSSQVVDQLIKTEASFFVYRDFQSRNIMWQNNSPWFIDFQSAYLGSQYYDLASLLYASKSGLDEPTREIILKKYHLLSKSSLSFEAFLEMFYRFVLVRRLRSLGTYGYLAGEKRKRWFFKSIQPTLIELTDLFATKNSLKSLVKTATMVRTILDAWENKLL